MSATETPDDRLPIGESAKLLGVSVETMRRWDAEGRIKSVRTLGGQRRFLRADIERAMAGDADESEVPA